MYTYQIKKTAQGSGKFLGYTGRLVSASSESEAIEKHLKHYADHYGVSESDGTYTDFHGREVFHKGDHSADMGDFYLTAEKISS